MDPIEKSGLYYANKFALIMLDALEDVLGKNGLKAVLNIAHLPELGENFPPDNLNKEFDFSDVSAINQALEEIYGPRGGRGLALRAPDAGHDRRRAKGGGEAIGRRQCLVARHAAAMVGREGQQIGCRDAEAIRQDSTQGRN